jgi:hypothetical protein
MKDREFRDYCAKRGLGAEQTEAHVRDVRDFEAFLSSAGGSADSLDSAGAEAARDYLADLVARGLNSEERLLALARYGYATGNDILYIYLAAVLGGREVVPRLSARALKTAGKAVRNAVFADLALPPLGSPPESYVETTRRLVEGLRARLPEDRCRDVLAGNNHGVPRRSFSRLRRVYRKSGLDAVLRLRHESLVATLEEHARSGQPWCEQRITLAVVDYVRRNPEIQSGVRSGQSIFVTKIPYDPVAYLEETDSRMKRYHACHCPLARASILDDGPAVPALWCYCSGGYEKLPFDVVFQQPTRVKVLESALAGDARCRFEVEVPGAEGLSPAGIEVGHHGPPPTVASASPSSNVHLERSPQGTTPRRLTQ